MMGWPAIHREFRLDKGQKLTTHLSDINSFKMGKIQLKKKFYLCPS